MKATSATSSVIIRIPCRLIEDKYGYGNYDDATDDIYGMLNSIVEAPQALYSAVSIDSSHTNPWFHTLDLTISGMQLFELQALEYKLKVIGLEPVLTP